MGTAARTAGTQGALMVATVISTHATGQDLTLVATGSGAPALSGQVAVTTEPALRADPIAAALEALETVTTAAIVVAIGPSEAPDTTGLTVPLGPREIRPMGLAQYFEVTVELSLIPKQPSSPKLPSFAVASSARGAR